LDVENEQVQFWYPILGKHKAPFHVFLIQDKFLKEFRYMLTRATPTRITQEAEDFLKGKGVCVHKEYHTYIGLYGYDGIPFLLIIFVFDRYFVAKVCRKYKTWSILFDKKRKRQFISLPFDVSNRTVRSSSHLIEVSKILSAFNLKEA